MRKTQDHKAIREKILVLLRQRRWWTVWMLSECCNCMETTASAKLRDLRKQRYGGHHIVGRRLPSSHAYEFCLVRPLRVGVGGQ